MHIPDFGKNLDLKRCRCNHECDRLPHHCEMTNKGKIGYVNDSANLLLESIYNVNRFRTITI